jgi:hypothetical protein
MSAGTILRFSPPAELVSVPLRPCLKMCQLRNRKSEHDEQTARAAEESHELKADPAHSTAVQGSDSGRAQSEAAGEGAEKQNAKDKT